MEMPIEVERMIAEQMEAAQGRARVTVDLQGETVTSSDGTAIAFKTSCVLREMLLLGADEIDTTLRRVAEISAFRARQTVRAGQRDFLSPTRIRSAAEIC